KKEFSEEIIQNSSAFIICINYIVGQVPSTEWLIKTNKLKAVIFHNKEKLEEWKKKDKGFKNLKLIPLFGAINIDSFLDTPIIRREPNTPFIIARHSTGDSRKFVSEQNKQKGEKIHCWQKHLIKDADIDFYNKLLRDVPNIHFRFMKGSNELYKEFKNHKKFTFYGWDDYPVTSFRPKE
ncbi:unnamed protein product, partial [marine sediment metagenome]